MAGLTRSLAAICLMLAIVASSGVQAMTIWQFDAMTEADRAEFVAVLVSGASRVLQEDGRGDSAEQMEEFFTVIEPGDERPVGMRDLDLALAEARATDLDNVQKDPGAMRAEVEEAFAHMLRKHGLELPEAFFTVARDFTPKDSTQRR
jgi:hypothetical protein